MLLRPLNHKPSDATDVIEHDGYSFTLKQWVDFLDGAIPYDTLRMRYRRGLRGDDLFAQVQPRTKLGINAYNAVVVKYKDEVHNLADWAEKLGLNVGLLYNRYRAGRRGDDLFSKKRLPARQPDQLLIRHQIRKSYNKLD
jgi:hypothetical protein